MLFQHTIKLVLTNQKRQTRRIVKSNEFAIRGRNNRIEAVVINGRDKWRVGKTYAVQPSRGKEQVGRIRLIAIKSQKLARISTHDALAEGFPNRKDFLFIWCKIHGDNALDLRVWVLEFEVVNMPHGESISEKAVHGRGEFSVATANAHRRSDSFRESLSRTP